MKSNHAKISSIWMEINNLIEDEKSWFQLGDDFEAKIWMISGLGADLARQGGTGQLGVFSRFSAMFWMAFMTDVIDETSSFHPREAIKATTKDSMAFKAKLVFRRFNLRHMHIC